MISEMVMIRGKAYTAVSDSAGVSENHGYHPSMIAQLVKIFDASGKIIWQKR